MFLMFMNMKTVHVVLLVWLVNPHYLQVATVNPKGQTPWQINLHFFYKNMTYKNMRLRMSKNKNIFKNIA